MFKKLPAKIDDNLNPILVKELRQVVNGNSLISIMSLGSVVMFIMLLIQLMMNDYNMEAGKNLYDFILLTLSIVLLIIIPAQESNKFLNEQKNKSMELLYSSTITPFGIFWGKYLTINVIALQIYSLALPYMTISYLLRGIDIFQIFLYNILLFIAMQPIISFSIFAASLRVSKVIFNLVMAGVLFGYMSLCVSVFSTLSRANAIFSGASAFMLALFTVVALEVTGFFVSLGVCAISSSPSNRAFSPRLYIAVSFIVNSIVMTILNLLLPSGVLSGSDLDGLNIGVYMIYFLLGLAGMLIASNERTEYNYRILSQIPRGVFKRIFVFPFFSGMANGMLFSFGLTFMLIIFIGGFKYLTSSGSLPSWDKKFLVGLAGVFLYTFSVSVWGYIIKKKWLGEKFPNVPATAYSLLFIFVSLIIPFFLSILSVGLVAFDEEKMAVYFILSFAGVFFDNIRYIALAADSIIALISLIFIFPKFIEMVRSFKLLESGNGESEKSSAEIKGSGAESSGEADE